MSNRSQTEADNFIGYPKEIGEGLLTTMNRNCFKDGFEKGVNTVLTWENLKRLDEIMTEVYKKTSLRESEEYYTEVIKRFRTETEL